MRTARLILLFCVFLYCIPVSANAQIDSLSYALGYETSIGLLAGENDLLSSESDLREYIRGLEENVIEQSLLSDSILAVNYGVGAAEAVYLANSLEHVPKRKRPIVNCIIEGLRKVADGSITLPYDTVGIVRELKAVQDSAKPASLPEDEKCRFYVNYGIMKGLQSDLQELLDEAGGNGVKADCRYYAQGMADMLELLGSKPKCAYDMGRIVGRTVLMNGARLPDVTVEDYIIGVKAAFGFSAQLMTREKVEELIQSVFSKYAETPVEEPIMAINVGGKEIEAGTRCSVHWNVSVYSVPERKECPGDVADFFDKALAIIGDKFGGSESCGFRFSDMVRFFSNDNVDGEDLLKCVSGFNNDISDGYKMFCLRSLGGEWTIGLASMNNPFTAFVGGASVEIEDGVKPVVGLSFRFGGDEHIDKAAEWAAFTSSNIGRPVVMEINGEAVMAPVVNSEITGGACSVTTTSFEEVERLLGY